MTSIGLDLRKLSGGETRRLQYRPHPSSRRDQRSDLLAFAGEIFIPPEVDAELTDLLPNWPGQRPPWVVVREVTLAEAKPLAGWVESGVIHKGEAAAIALTGSLAADWFLTDDASARLLAGTLGLEVHGSLGVVLWAAATGKVTPRVADELLTCLAGSTLWISQRILSEARGMLAEIDN